MTKSEAEIIIMQMGGYRVLRMFVGVTKYVFSSTEGFISFKFHGNPSMNYCKIFYYYGKDLYKMQFINYKDFTYELVDEVDDVFFDMLVPIFESCTDLFLSFT